MTIIDAHSDYILYVYREYLRGNKNILLEKHLPELRKGGVNIEVLTVGGDFDFYPEINIREANTIFKIIDFIHNEISENPETFTLIKTSKDFEKIQKNEKIGFILALEGAESIGREFYILRNYYRLGVRSVALTHNERNLFADGCTENPPGALSIIGKDLIKELNKYNILIDLVHISEPSFWDVLELLEKPPIISHSNAKSICNHVRNLTDNQIEAIAKNNGVIGVNFFSRFIDEKPKNANIERLIDHIDYYVNLIGIDHIGLGPDFLDYFAEFLGEMLKNNPQNNGDLPDVVKYGCVLKDPSELPKLTKALQKRGYSDKEIKKIQNENFLRVFNEVL